MSRATYVDKPYVLHRSAAVLIEYRGYQFADGVYEVRAMVGEPLVQKPHLVRLARPLSELRIAVLIDNSALKPVMHEVRRNGVGDGIVYLQMTRPVGRRDYAFSEAA